MARGSTTLTNTGSILTPTQKATEDRVLETPVREEKESVGVKETPAVQATQSNMFDTFSPMDNSEVDSNVDEFEGVPTVDSEIDFEESKKEYEEATATGPLLATENAFPRGREEGRVDLWDFNQSYFNRSQAQRNRSMQAARETNEDVQNDGGLSSRVINLADQVEIGNIGLGGLTAAAKDNLALNVLNSINAINPETRKPDRDFLQVAAIVTEDSMATMAMQDGVEAYELMEQDGETFQGTNKKGRPVTKVVPGAQGRVQIGRRIHSEYQKIKGVESPTDISKDDAETLGSLAKELYFAANESDANPIIELVHINKGVDQEQRAFRITPYGETMLSAGTWKRAKMFPKDKIRPSKTPLEKGKLVGEPAQVTRNISGAKGSIVGTKEINQAKENMSKIPNLVLPSRLKILLATVLPVLSGVVTAENDIFGLATINHVGIDKLNSLRAQAKKKRLPKLEEDREVARNYNQLINMLAQDVYGIALERHGANFLTYYTQAFSGRISDAQQNTLNPTRSKTSRFVTSNAVPARVGNRSASSKRYEKALRQMYAMVLVKDADALIPTEREFMLDTKTPQIYAWGKVLRDAMNNISDADVQKVASAIEQGVPMMIDGKPNPEFPQLPKWASSIDPEANKELIEAIKDKGEDGQVYIDGLIDFANYQDKKNNPDSNGNYEHQSFFNAMMDGKTNGLASNGMQMGIEAMAFRTGVLRQTGSKTFLNNNEDIRDQLAENLLKEIDKGFSGTAVDKDTVLPSLKGVARILYQDRALNKQTTMTFPYGRELESFKSDIQERLNILIEESKQLQDTKDPLYKLAGYVESLNLNKINNKLLIETLHAKYVDGLMSTLSPEVIASRAMMRSIAQMAGISNELFTIVSPTGFELNLGGSVTTGLDQDASKQVKVWSPKDKSVRPNPKEKLPISEMKKSEPTVPKYGEVITAAAEKQYTNIDEETGLDVVTFVPGDIAYGGSVPAPMHSIDAATVVKTMTGKSWDKLMANSQGHPYVHTVYDAFKVDAMSYDTILEEANTNWYEVNMQWSYLEAAKQSLAEVDRRFNERFKGVPDSQVLTEPTDISVMQYLLEFDPDSNVLNDKNKTPTFGYPNLARKLTKTLPPGSDIEPALIKIISSVDEAFTTDQPTLGDLKQFRKTMMESLNINKRLNDMIRDTNKNKKKLKQVIDKAIREGRPVYQYYSH